VPLVSGDLRKHSGVLVTRQREKLQALLEERGQYLPLRRCNPIADYTMLYPHGMNPNQIL
jgi:hypothetical protein